MNTTRRELDASEIDTLLREVGTYLDHQGLHAAIYIVGGAAISLTLDKRRVTDDIDAVFDHSEALDTAIATVGATHGLSAQWLSDAVTPYTNRSTDTGATLLEVPGLSLSIASPRHLLAMKMVAFRPQDMNDLKVLFGHLSITSATEVVDIVWETYGEYAESIGGGSRDDLFLRAEAVLRALDQSSR